MRVTLVKVQHVRATVPRQLPRGARPLPRRWWALAALVMSALVIGLDATILVTALPTLSEKLGAGTSDLQWFSDAYTLALGGLLLPAGTLGDHYGRRRFLLIGLVLFGLSSVAASQMSSATGLIWMRAVMGAGAALILPLTLPILPAIFDEEERPRAVAFAAAGAFLGLPLGPLVAGWLLTHYSWGSVFLINAPVTVLAILGIWLIVPESKDAHAPPVDWVGALLSAIGVTGVVYGIIQEPGYGWSDTGVLVGVVGGGAVLAAFLAWDARARCPLIDLRLFQNPRFTWSTAAFVVSGFAMMGVLFVLTPYLQIVQGADAEGTGVRLFPMIGSIMVGAVGSDRITARVGTKWVVASGLLVTGAGLVVLSRVGAESGYGLVATALVVTGIGLGLAMPPALDAVLASLPASQTGVGTALSRTLQQIAASLGVAILGTLLNGVYVDALRPHLGRLPMEAVKAAESGVAGAAGVAPVLPTAAGLSLTRWADEAYAHSMSDVLLVCAGLREHPEARASTLSRARVRCHDDRADRGGLGSLAEHLLPVLSDQGRCRSLRQPRSAGHRGVRGAAGEHRPRASVP